MLNQTKKKSKSIVKSNKISKPKRIRIDTKKIVLNDYSIIEGCIRQTMELPIENSGNINN
jgi:hypothetical protein